MTQQDDITQRVLTDDEIQALWDEACKDSPQAPGWNRHIRFARALLSQVRAPVADKRFKPPFDNCSFRMCDLPGQCRGEGRCHHPASAPVAEPRLEWSAKALYDAIKDVLLNHRLSNLVDEDGEFFPLVDHLRSQDDKTTESGEFEIALICDAIYNDVLTKSAPVAGEAVYTLRVRGAIQAWTPTAAAFSIPDGEHQLFLSPAAPQASEAVRTHVLAALESAQRFIRNGIEFGYIRMPDADTPDPAHRTPGLIDAAIRSLKSQADKDGGQQRAGDGKTREALNWYAEQVAGCRKFGPDGEAARHALDRDGGQLARAALSATQAEQGERDA